MAAPVLAQLAVSEPLNYARAALCHPLTLALQCQGCAILLSLALGWFLAAQPRLRALRRLKNAEHACSGCEWGKVSVVLPVKGVGQHSLSNWRSQLASDYRGTSEFIFVVESLDDPAYEPLMNLRGELEGKISVQVQLAGKSWKCSQKIHNQLTGVQAMAADSEYVLFLDDDIRIHPSTITDLVAAMRENPSTFLVTGYPFDVPTAQLASYCILVYHLPLFIGFSTGGTTTFVWGGCMLMHAADFREDRYGLVTALRDGGYSDDMTLAAIAGKHGRRVCVPDTAVFLHPLAADLSMAKYWNYLRRQIFVLETYCSPFNRLLNRTLFLVHCWLSWGLVLPIVPSAVHAIDIILHFLHFPSSAHICSSGVYAAWLWFLCVLTAWTTLSWMTKAVLDLCTALDPKASSVPVSAFRWDKIFVGMVIGNFVYPVCALYTWLRPHVEWSGVRYFRKAGKIKKIVRAGEARGRDWRQTLRHSPVFVRLFDHLCSTERLQKMKADS